MIITHKKITDIQKLLLERRHLVITLQRYNKLAQQGKCLSLYVTLGSYKLPIKPDQSTEQASILCNTVSLLKAELKNIEDELSSMNFDTGTIPRIQIEQEDTDNGHRP